MLPFLKVFGSELGNGLSHFAVDKEAPGYGKNITYFLDVKKLTLSNVYCSRLSKKSE